MSRWFRHYAGMMRDDKLVRAALKAKQSIERTVWVWGAILESAAEIDDNGRYEVDAAEIAHFLRCKPAHVEAIIAALQELGRIDHETVSTWSKRQFKSDRSNDRVTEYRAKKRAERNADVTLQERHGNAPETETETETEEEKTPSGKKGGSDYAFEGNVVRLNRRDYDKWRSMFTAIPDFDAELTALDSWLAGQSAAKQKSWFGSAAPWLNRRHQEALEREKPRGEPAFASPC